MMLILKEVTAENWQQVVALRMPQAHRRLVPSNAYSLAEARFIPDRIPLAVYDEQTLIGLVVVSYNETLGRGWIHRFMIDQQFVNKGYSRKTIKMVIRRMRRLQGCQVIGVDYQKENTILEQFYEGLHFQRTGQTTPDGDTIAILRVRPEQPEPARADSTAAPAPPAADDTLALTTHDQLADEVDLSEEDEGAEPSEQRSVSSVGVARS